MREISHRIPCAFSQWLSSKEDVCTHCDRMLKHKLLIDGILYVQKIVVAPQEVIAHAIRLTELLLQILPFVENV